MKYAEREPREFKGKFKYSYRLYVLNVRITSKNIKTLLIENGLNNNPIYDMSIYDKNKVLFLPLTTKKAYDIKVPALIPINCDSFIVVHHTLKKIMKIGILNFKLIHLLKK